VRTLRDKLSGRPEPEKRRAALIVPLVLQGEDLQILFERRAENLRRSSAEVGFPGGIVEDGENPFQAALRELKEETGIEEGRVSLLGRLPQLGHRAAVEQIIPFVCLLEGPVDLSVQGQEVAELFFVPLSFLMERGFNAAQLIETLTLSPDFPQQLLPGGSWQRRTVRPVYYLQYREKLIWGLSAEIVVSLLALLA